MWYVMSYTPVGVDACGAVRVAERVTGIEPALSAWEVDSAFCFIAGQGHYYGLIPSSRATYVP